MFELNNQYRESFLNRLEELIKEIDIRERMIAKADDHIRDYYNASLFLLEQEKKTIIKALSDNKIDY